MSSDGCEGRRLTLRGVVEDERSEVDADADADDILVTVISSRSKVVLSA